MWKLLAVGALALLVVLLAAERSSVDSGWGAAVKQRIAAAAEEGRRGAAGGGMAAARADRTRRASKVRMIHVGKTGGATARRYLHAEQIHLNLVRQDEVRPPRSRDEYPTAARSGCR